MLLESPLYQEKELLMRLAHGDEVAFRAVFDHYHAALFLNVMRLLHTEEEARDVVQEVFILLWEKRAAIDIDKGVGGWLFVLSYNRSVNHLKKKLRREMLEQQADSLDKAGMDAADEALLVKQEAVLGDALATLSPQKRKAFELCRLQGKTYEAAALEMGISKHTVNEYLKQAMVAIREYIREHPPYDTTLAILALEIFFQ
jgi:RNA polymerase sigma-70 factor (ECF subfamily)